jgi:hypothetical protein
MKFRKPEHGRRGWSPMAPTGSQVGSLIFGGLFIGVWLFLALFRTDITRDLDIGLWVMWGVVGLVLAGAIYGTRFAKGGLRVTLFVLVGIATGMLLTGFLLQGLEEGIATMVTLVGGGLVASALPSELQRQGEFARA